MADLLGRAGEDACCLPLTALYTHFIPENEQAFNTKTEKEQMLGYRRYDGNEVCLRIRRIRKKAGSSLYKAQDFSGIHGELEYYRDLELRHSQVLQVSNLGTWDWDLSSGEMEFNERWAGILGYTLEELQPIDSDTWLRFVHPEDVETSDLALKAHIEGRTPHYECIIRMKHKNGHWVWVLDKGKVVSRDASGKAARISGTHQDVTELIRQENEVKRIKSTLEYAGRVARIGAWELNIQTQQVFWDDVVRNIHEVDEQFVVNLDRVIGYYEGDNRQRIREAFRACLEEGKPFDEELQMITAKGKKTWVRKVAYPYLINGRVAGISGLLQDISPTRELLRSLKKQEETFRQTFENAPNGMTLVSLEGKFMKVNRNLCKMLGYEEDELLRLTFQDITYPDDLEQDLKLLNELVAGKRDSYRMEKRYYHKKGQVIWADLSVSMVSDNEGNPEFFISQISDISLMKRVQKRLKEVNLRLQSVYNATTELAIIEVGADGIIRSINKGTETLLGYSQADLENTIHINRLWPTSYLERRQLELEDQFGERVSMEEVLWVKPRKGQFEAREGVMQTKDGLPKPVFGTITPVHDALKNAFTGYLITATDFSAMKEARDKIEHLLDLSQDQNDRLMNFAHIVSHNLRSHAGNFAMLIDLMKMDVPEHTDHHFFPMLENSALALKETIEHLNEVVVMHSRIHDHLESLNLLKYTNQVLRSITPFLLEKKATIRLDIDASLQVRAIPAYLTSILHNLVSNAAKYRRPDTDPIITLSAKKKGAIVELGITDNGLGIDMEKHGKLLFSMYKTFHGNKDARGVGLFLTKNQVEAMGGEIRVMSSKNVGSTFIVILNADET